MCKVKECFMLDVMTKYIPCPKTVEYINSKKKEKCKEREK